MTESSSAAREMPPKERSALEAFLVEKLDFTGNEELRTRIEGLIVNPENFLGKGGTAQVYTLGYQCIKIMPNRHDSSKSGMFKLGNSVDVEYKTQLSLNGLEVGGVVTPAVFSYYKGADSAAIVMERLNAVDMQRVLNREDDFPVNFNANLFFNSLADFLDAMHERGIVHCDLSPRNLMIDRVSGMPRVIDFGRAKMIPRNESDRTEAQQKLVLDDIDKIEDARNTVEDFLANI